MWKTFPNASCCVRKPSLSSPPLPPGVNPFSKEEDGNRFFHPLDNLVLRARGPSSADSTCVLRKILKVKIEGILWYIYR